MCFLGKEENNPEIPCVLGKVSKHYHYYISFLFSFFSRGWLIDATAGYPVHEVRENCGNMTGIVSSATVYDKATKTFDAWYHKD